MSRRIAAAVVLLLVLAVVAILLPLLQRTRLNAALAASQNNLRELSLFAAHHAKPEQQDGALLLNYVPAATVFLPGVPSENRLSWIAPVLPGLNQKRQDIVSLLAQIDDTQPWTAERNQTAGRTVLFAALCPENAPQVAAGSPALTCYVGIAGLGTDAATLPLLKNVPPSPRAGAFRYDAPTPFDRITDGLSETVLMGETADSPGPWLRGGFSTVRGMDDAAGAKPLIGDGGQFGGFFPAGANFALCDGSVRMFTPRTTPSVLLRMATIAGGENEMGAVD
jgi:Protein of unknown function (DUF1559)